MKASVLIPTYEIRGEFTATVRAVCDQTIPPDEYEIFILDNNWLTKEGIFLVQEIQSSNKNLHVLRDKDKKFTELYNEAARRAKGEYLLFTASHCIPKRDWIEKWTAHIKQKNRSAAAGAIKSVPSDNAVSNLEHKRNEEFMPILWNRNDGAYFDYHNAIIRKDLFLENSGVTEALSQVISTMELGARLHSKNDPVLFVKEFTVPHMNEKSFYWYCESAYNEGLDKTIIYLTHGKEFGLKYFNHPRFARHMTLLKRIRWPLILILICAQILFTASFHLAELINSESLKETSIAFASRFAHNRGQLRGFSRRSG